MALAALVFSTSDGRESPEFEGQFVDRARELERQLGIGSRFRGGIGNISPIFGDVALESPFASGSGMHIPFPRPSCGATRIACLNAEW